MNTYYVDDEGFQSSKIYQDFLEKNQSKGNLRIKASAASGAIPISGLKVTISKNILNSTIIFFEGYTNESGIIEKISLPAPKETTDNLIEPTKETYDITAIYAPDNTIKNYKVDIYDSVCVIQYINIVPKMNLGDMNGR